MLTAKQIAKPVNTSAGNTRQYATSDKGYGYDCYQYFSPPSGDGYWDLFRLLHDLVHGMEALY